MAEPAPCLSLIDHAVAPSVLAAAYDVFRRVRIPPATLYLPATELGQSEAIESRYGRTIASFLHRHCSQLIDMVRTFTCDSYHGCEIWTNVAEQSTENVVFHVDNDEHHRERTREVRTPLVGSICYLGPEAIPTGGGTCFCLEPSLVEKHRDWLFSSTPWSDVHAAIGDASVIVPFRVGRMILFRGHLGHCVVPFEGIASSQPRVSLLVNFWRSPLTSLE